MRDRFTKFVFLSRIPFAHLQEAVKFEPYILRYIDYYQFISIHGTRYVTIPHDYYPKLCVCAFFVQGLQDI